MTLSHHTCEWIPLLVISTCVIVFSRNPWIVRGDDYRCPQPVQDDEEGRAESARHQRQRLRYKGNTPLNSSASQSTDEDVNK